MSRPLPDPPVPFSLRTGQEAGKVGRFSQTGRLETAEEASAHSLTHSWSLIATHSSKVGCKETPEVSHNPKSDTHRNGTTASWHSGLGFTIPDPDRKYDNSKFAVESSSRNTKGAPRESQFALEERMPASASRQISLACDGYGNAFEHSDSVLKLVPLLGEAWKWNTKQPKQ